MKKILYIAMFILLFTVSACKPKAESEVVTAKEVPVQQWTYQWVSKQCSYDGGSHEVICLDLTTGDQTMLGNLIGSAAADGYELDQVVHSNNGSGIVQTFIFRKPYVAPVVTE